jgi:uncharacterized protein YdaU (DUF1376 family)
MPWYIGDYLRDTAHLVAHEHGAYMMMLAHAWQHDGALPLDHQRIRRIAKLTPEQWQESEGVLMEFWQKNGSAYRQKRTDAELEKAKAKYQQQVNAGKARATVAQRESSGRWADSQRTIQRTSSQPEPEPESELELDSELDSDSKEPLEPLVAVTGSPGSKRPLKQYQGHRLPDRWELPDPWLRWALNTRPDWNEERTLRESLIFRDHWHAKAGKDANKVDWQATWRNWIRRAT